MQESFGQYMLSGEVLKRATRVLNALILLTLVTLIVALTISKLSNNDIWQHLKSGQMLLQTHRFQYADLYSCSAAGTPLINEEWLSGVIYYLAYLTGGVSGIIYLKSLAILIMTGLVLVNSHKLRIPFILFIPVTVFMLFNAGIRFLARPEIFSYVFLAAFLYILMHYKYMHTSWRSLVFIPILQIFWSNMHGAFILGVCVTVIFAGCETLRLLISRRFALWQHDVTPWVRLKPLYIIVCLTVLACLVNPYGIRLLVQPFHIVMENREFIKTIYEWQSPFESNLFRGLYAFKYYIGWMILLGFSFLVNIKRLDLSHLAISLFFSIMAFEMHRNIALLTIATCPIICLNLHQGGISFFQILDWKPPCVFGLIGRLFILILLVPLIIFSFEHGYIYGKNNSKPFGMGVAPNMPVKATEYIQTNHITGCCLNSYTYGAYLIFHCFPDTRVTMDARAEHVYSKEYYGYYRRALLDVQLFEKFLEQYNISHIILDYSSGILDRHCEYLRKTGTWALVYFDDACFIYVRRLLQYEDLISRDEYRYIHPLLTLKGMRIPRGELDAVIEECRRNLKTNPGWLFPHALLSDLYIAKGDWAKVIEHGTVVVEGNASNYDACMKLGFAYGRIGDFKAAKSMYLKALSINPASRIASDALVRLKKEIGSCE